MALALQGRRAHAPTFAATAILTSMLALAAAGWAFTVRATSGMDMGVATQLGSLQFFVAAWVPMMAAMMLPGACPALIRRARAGRSVLAVPQFAVSYLGAWTVVGIVAYALYRPHGTAIAGVLTVAAGVYELTPLKRACRVRCRQNVESGTRFGLYCIGSSVGLMLLLLVVGAMSVTWMAVVATLVLAQKVLPPSPALDVPLAVSIVGLGIAIAAAPSSIPGIT